MMDDDRQPPPFVGLILVSATDSMSVPGNKSARRGQHQEESVWCSILKLGHPANPGSRDPCNLECRLPMITFLTKLDAGVADARRAVLRLVYHAILAKPLPPGIAQATTSSMTDG